MLLELSVSEIQDLLLNEDQLNIKVGEALRLINQESGAPQLKDLNEASKE